MQRSYAEQTLDNPNPFARFAHRRRHLAALSSVASVAPYGATVLDFGCGEGDFLNALATQRPDLRLWGFDPYTKQVAMSYEKVEDLAIMGDHTVDVVTCFETLEHLTEAETSDFTRTLDRILRADGKLVASVPIVAGPVLLLKEANRSILFRRRTDYSARELLRTSLLGQPAPRAENIKTSHKGFDYRKVEETLGEMLRLLVKQYSPFPRAPWWINSQVFYVYGR